MAPPPGSQHEFGAPQSHVIWLCIQYFFWSIGVYGFVLWLPSIIQKGAARCIAITGLFSGVPYVVAMSSCCSSRTTPTAASAANASSGHS